MNRRFLTSLICAALCAIVVIEPWPAPYAEHKLSIVSPGASPGASPGSVVNRAPLSLPGLVAGAGVAEAVGKLPLSFEVNQGQMDAAIKFAARGAGYQVLLTSEAVVLSLPGREGGALPASAVLMKLQHAAGASLLSGEAELPGKMNYFRGNDARRWHTGVPTFARVRARDVYPGVDVVYYGNQQQLEYDFIVAPGAQVQAIELKFTGADSIEIDERGDLLLHTASGPLRQHKPVVYQEAAGQKQMVAGQYALKGNGAVGFEVGDYDPTAPLVIDPVLSYATFLGGSSSDIGYAIALDNAGNIYLAGMTVSLDFPISGNAFQTALAPFGGFDLFVTKLSPGGAAIIYSTFIGGDDIDQPSGLAIDSSGNAHITGYTRSFTFPTANAIQPNKHFGVRDGFVTKLNATGSALIYSTYFGGNNGVNTEGHGIAVDAAGNAYVGGYTSANDFLTTAGAFRPNYAGGSNDAFVTKFNAAGGVIYSTFLGGAGDDAGNDIAIDSGGNAYVTGTTFSTNFPTQNPIRPALADSISSDAFVTKLSAAGSGLVYSTYLGGVGNDQGKGIAVDSAGSAYVTGFTRAPDDFPVVNAFQPTYGGSSNLQFPADAFVTRLNPAGAAFVYSTYLGGGGADVGNRIAVDNAGNAYVTGNTGSVNPPFPTKNAFQPVINGVGTNDAFVTCINTSLSGQNSLIYSSYLGGMGSEIGNSIALDNTGKVYIFGQTRSADFPTLNPLPGQNTLKGDEDAFLVIVSNLSLTPASQLIEAGGSGSLTVGINPQSSATTITLSSSNPSVASVPPSVTVPANASTAAFPVTGVAAGDLVTITATMPANLGGGSATAIVLVAVTQVALVSGQPQTGSIPTPVPPNSGVLGLTQYTIAVPAGATQLRVDLSGNTNVDLYMRFGQRVAVQGGQVVADYGSQSPGGTESITINAASAPPLQAGTYFIAMGNFGPGPATFTVTATVTGGQTCTYSISPTSQSFPAGGGNGSVGVTTGNGCAWTGVSNNGFITINSGSSGNGNGTVNYSVAANTGPQRTGTMTIAQQTFTVTQSSGCATITISPTTLPNGTATVAYSQTLTASGGAAPYSFAVTAGALPSGLSLSSAGLLSGAATAFGNFNFTVTATGANGCTGTRAYTLTINPPCGAITVNPATLANGFAGAAYNQTLSATGGAPAYSFNVSAGALPAGLTLAQGGALTGAPNATGVFNFTIRATDSGGCQGVRDYTIVVSGNGLMFYPLAHPVRLLETRNNPAFPGCYKPNAKIPGGVAGIRTQPARGACDGLTIPAGAMAITGNITTVESGGGYLTLWPSGAQQPTVANSNYNPNEILNNVFTVGLGAADGAFKIFVTSDTDIVIDVTGYYAPPPTAGAGGLYFHPLPTPIRLLETRNNPAFAGCDKPNAPLPGGVDTPQQARGLCQGVTIPANAQAIVGNATTVNPGGGYFTLYPSGAARPTVASSNYLAGQIMNAPFTVGLGADGAFMIFPTSSTDLVIDVLGYYSPDAVDANGRGLLFTPLARPIRLLETRNNPAFPGCYKPNAPLTGGSIRTQTAWGGCDGLTIPTTALALVGNATTVNPAGGYLTFWPSTAAQPTVATSNFTAGQVFNRHFIVGLGNTDGAFKIFASGTTDLVIDLSGYFAP